MMIILMNHCQAQIIMNILPLLLIIGMTSCQSSTSTTPVMPDNSIVQGTSIDSNSHHDDFCDYFYSKDTLNDTLHFNFEDREDFGPVYLSDNELKQIYCEIKRGNINAYKLLFLHYFYTYPTNNFPKSEIDKLICITDFLAQKYSYYRGYLMCGGFIFDYLKFNADDDYYTTTMITYYEKYFELSQSKDIAMKLYEIYCGNYSFHDKDSVKAKYYEKVLGRKR